MKRILPFTLLGLALLLGCGGAGSTTFVHPEYNFSYLERIAVVPFENLTPDQGAGARATRYFLAELLATESFDVVEPGEVTLALSKVGVRASADLTQEQATELGSALGIQGVLLGTVGESASRRGGTRTTTTVSLVVRMVETDTGVTVWTTTSSADSRGFWSGLFGTAERSASEVMGMAVQRAVDDLVD